MTTPHNKHTHPYARLTIAEARLVDSDEIPTDAQVARAYIVMDALGLEVFGPNMSEGAARRVSYGAGAVAERLRLMRSARKMLSMGIYPDNINDPYTHQQSGETQSLGDWYDDYQCTDAESWHGKEATAVIHWQSKVDSNVRGHGSELSISDAKRELEHWQMVDPETSYHIVESFSAKNWIEDGALKPWVDPEEV